MQIDERTKVLATAAGSEERKEEIHNASKRLVDPKGMGTQYQFLGIVSKERDVLLPPFDKTDCTG